MIYQAFQPDAALRPHVRALYYFCGDQGDSRVPHTFRFPSDGGPELLFNLGDPFEAGNCESRLQTFSGGSMIGPLSCHLLTRTAGLTAFVAVRFRPGGTAPFLDVPSHELTDLSVDIGTIWGPFAKDTEQRVKEARTPADAVSIVQGALWSRRSPRFSPDWRMDLAIDAIFASRGCLRVGHLAGAAGLSRRQFERRFKRVVGLSAKRLCRIVRFATLCSRISGSGQHRWARIALACGYSDQAHMIRECRFFTGHSPQAYLKHRSPLEDAIFTPSVPMSHLFNTHDTACAMMPPNHSL